MERRPTWGKRKTMAMTPEHQPQTAHLVCKHLVHLGFDMGPGRIETTVSGYQPRTDRTFPETAFVPRHATAWGCACSHIGAVLLSISLYDACVAHTAGLKHKSVSGYARGCLKRSAAHQKQQTPMDSEHTHAVEQDTASVCHLRGGQESLKQRGPGLKQRRR